MRQNELDFTGADATATRRSYWTLAGVLDSSGTPNWTLPGSAEQPLHRAAGRRNAAGHGRPGRFQDDARTAFDRDVGFGINCCREFEGFPELLLEVIHAGKDRKSVV